MFLSDESSHVFFFANIHGNALICANDITSIQNRTSLREMKFTKVCMEICSFLLADGRNMEENRDI